MEVFKLNAIVSLYSMEKTEIEKFLSSFYHQEIKLKTDEWEKSYQNPVEMAEIIGTFIDNNDKFHINMWISIDKGFSINVTEHNANQIIKYLYERFPY